jgi:predicted RNase H-like HicB family nuclease
MITTMSLRYNINIFWSSADDCWIADVSDLRGCSAHGATPEDAAREAQVAMGLWVETAQDHGDPVPEPRYRHAIYAAKAA